MQLQLLDDLPFVTVRLRYRERDAEIAHVLLDTGSGATVFAADVVMAIGIVPEPADRLYTMGGVGGSEVVFARKIDKLQVGESQMAAFEIQVGAMDYGFDVNGILGMDYPLAVGAVVDLRNLEISFGR